jgi:hypothetical protein
MKIDIETKDFWENVRRDFCDHNIHNTQWLCNVGAENTFKDAWKDIDKKTIIKLHAVEFLKNDVCCDMFEVFGDMDVLFFPKHKPINRWKPEMREIRIRFIQYMIKQF